MSVSKINGSQDGIEIAVYIAQVYFFIMREYVYMCVPLIYTEYERSIFRKNARYI